MRRPTVIIFIFIILTSFLYKKMQVDDPFKELQRLDGVWIMKKGNVAIGEAWVKVNDKLLQGSGFYLKGNDTIVTERVALKKMNNEIVYTSTVMDQNNQQPVDFKLTSARNNIFVFENPVHDFPKRIVYEFVGEDSIHAFIDAGIGRKENRRDFYYKKHQ